MNEDLFGEMRKALLSVLVSSYLMVKLSVGTVKGHFITSSLLHPLSSLSV